MKKIFTLLFCAAILLSGAACSENSSSEGSTVSRYRENLIGTWEITADYDAEFKLWEYDWGAKYDCILRYTFNTDGTGSFYLLNGGESTTSFTYTISDKNIQMMNDGFNTPADFTFTKLTANSFTWLTEEYEAVSDGRIYRDKEVYKRVK